MGPLQFGLPGGDELLVTLLTAMLWAALCGALTWVYTRRRNTSHRGPWIVASSLAAFVSPIGGLVVLLLVVVATGSG